MSQNLHKPVFRCRPIGSIAALAKALNIEQEELISVAEAANDLYRLAKPIVKVDGSIRQPFDAQPRLKRVHAKIKTEILERIDFPPYLTGSLKGRDYRTNAALHTNQKVMLCEDIQNFFPSVSDRLVFDAWRLCMNFPPVVAEVLTKLTVKDGALPQGAITSSYLANIILHRWEPTFQLDMATRGLTYSRYVDDIVISSPRALKRPEKTEIVAKLYGMLAAGGLRAKRRKHEVFAQNGPMIATKLLVNKRVAIPKMQRAAIRAAVHHVEVMLDADTPADVLGPALSKAGGRVSNLSLFHKSEAKALAERLRAVRNQQATNGILTGSTQALPLEHIAEIDDPPWA